MRCKYNRETKYPIFILGEVEGDYLILDRNSSMMWQVMYLPENRKLEVHYNKILRNEAPVPSADRYVVCNLISY